MDFSKPTLLVISGLNGAGKSTHIQTMLPDAFAGIWSFDRDQARSEFEAELSKQGVAANAFTKRATDMMEEKLVYEMKKAIADKRHFVLETPLYHADYWRYLDLFEANGYQIQLSYLCLDKVGDCIGRVGQRVLEGGYYVAPDTIKGVYEKNLQHINEFRNTFAVVELYDGMKVPTLLVRMETNKVTLASELALKKKWIKQGLPGIAAQITAYLSNQERELKTKIRIRKAPGL